MSYRPSPSYLFSFSKKTLSMQNYSCITWLYIYIYIVIPVLSRDYIQTVAIWHSKMPFLIYSLCMDISTKYLNDKNKILWKYTNNAVIKFPIYFISHMRITRYMLWNNSWVISCTYIQRRGVNICLFAHSFIFMKNNNKHSYSSTLTLVNCRHPVTSTAGNIGTCCLLYDFLQHSLLTYLGKNNCKY